MSQITQVKEKLLAEIEVLPEHRLPEVLDFVAFLRHQDQQAVAKTAPSSSRDPFQEYIGGVAHGALAQDIDQELYES